MTRPHTLSDAYRALRLREAEKQAALHTAMAKSLKQPELVKSVAKINKRRIERVKQ